MKRTLVTERDIINTYSNRQQKLAYQFLETMRLRKKFKFGYVRISNILGAPESRVRHWLYENTKPIPIKTIEELKNIGWLPLTLNHPNIRWLARISGFLFGDGHLSPGNYISFSFSNIKDLDLLKGELKNYFRKEVKVKIEESQGTIKGRKFKGINYELRIYSTSIVRFLHVLGIPKGDKTRVYFDFPKWVWSDKEILREFTRSLLWTEFSAPRLQKKGDVSIGAMKFTMKKYDNKESFIKFLNDLRRALKTFGIQTTEIKESKENRFDFYVKNNQLNILRLTNELPPIYASDKEKKLEEIMVKVKDVIKKEKSKIELYKKTMALREKYGWGSRKIAKKLGTKKDLVDNWIYHGNKPRLFKR